MPKKLTKHEQSQQYTTIVQHKRNAVESERTFQEQFPELKSISLEVRVEHQQWPEKYENPKFISAVIGCRNGLCTGGGFEFLERIKELVQERKIEIDTSIICRGKEKIGKSLRSCMRFAQVKGRLIYKT